MEEFNKVNQLDIDLDKITPNILINRLNKYVVGQDLAKKIISVGVYNHIKRVVAHLRKEAPIDKSNLLILGPTGCGKTYLIESLCKELKIPLGICDATEFTETGYWGGDIEDCLINLFKSAGNSAELAERGIVYIDEIDKIAEPGEHGGKRDITGKGVQRSLLKIIEGKVVKLCIRAGVNKGNSEYVDVDTKNILFILGGAFAGLAEQIENKRGFNKTIGFHSESKDKGSILKEVRAQDLIDYGFMPEFVGRVGNYAILNQLTEDNLVDILTKPRNSIVQQYVNLFNADFVRLTITPTALNLIAKYAISLGTGARGLRSIMERCLIDLMCECADLPEDTEVELTAAIVKAKLGNFI